MGPGEGLGIAGRITSCEDDGELFHFFVGLWEGFGQGGGITSWEVDGELFNFFAGLGEDFRLGSGTSCEGSISTQLGLKI